MTLATVDADGRPSARIVLLKGVDARGFAFYTNHESRKGRALAAQSRAPRCCSSGPISSGRCASRARVEPVADAEADAYFAGRPRASRLGAWASPQSAPIADRAALERRFDDVAQRYAAAGDAVPRPPHWGGYRVVPDAFEFWQGRALAAARSHRVSQGRRCVVDPAARAVSEPGRPEREHRSAEHEGSRVRSGALRPSPFGVLIALGIANHIVLAGSRVAVTLYALSLGAGTATVGVLMALYAFLPDCSRSSPGRLTDRIGVRKPMLVGSCGIALGAGAAFAVPGLPSLFVAATLIGVSFMAFQVAAQNATGEMGGAAGRVRNFGLLALGYSVSSIVAPLTVGFAIDHFGFRASFALLMLLPLVPVAVLAADRLRLPGPHPAHAPHPLSRALELVKHRQMRRVFVINALISMAWDMHTIFVPIYGNSIGLSASMIGAILSAFAAATFVVRLAMPVIARRLSEYQVLTVALFLGGADLPRDSVLAQRGDAGGAVVLPGHRAWRRPADGDGAAAQPRAAGPHGRGRRRADGADQRDGSRRAAPFRRGGRRVRRSARALVGRRVPHHRRVADPPGDVNCGIASGRSLAHKGITQRRSSSAVRRTPCGTSRPSAPRRPGSRAASCCA